MSILPIWCRKSPATLFQFKYQIMLSYPLHTIFKLQNYVKKIKPASKLENNLSPSHVFISSQGSHLQHL